MEKKNQKEIILFIENIIQKKFSKSAKGYSPDEVDTTLDSIFENFSNTIDLYDDISKNNIALKEQINTLESEIEKYKEEVSLLKSTIEKYEKKGYGFEIMNERINDIAKGISLDNKSSK